MRTPLLEMILAGQNPWPENDAPPIPADDDLLAAERPQEPRRRPAGGGLADLLRAKGKKRLRGKVSTFGGPNDPMDNNKTASGIPNTVPGIATYDRKTLGGYWLVKNANGKEAVLRQVDIGPAPWTGRKIDVNPPGVRKLGGVKTDSVAKAIYLGKRKPR